MTANSDDGSLTIGTVSTTVSFQGAATAPQPVEQGDDIIRLRALLRPIITDLLRDELRTALRMRG